jgi:hypothetical protein
MQEQLKSEGFYAKGGDVYYSLLTGASVGMWLYHFKRKIFMSNSINNNVSTNNDISAILIENKYLRNKYLL